MAFKIYYKEPSKGRAEWWDRKTYATEAAARRALIRDKSRFNWSKGEILEIRKVSAPVANPWVPRIRIPRRLF